MKRKYDESWVGKKFGRLTVVEYLSKEGRFVCECVCGNRSVVVPVNLIRGKVKSCGCYNRDITRERMTVHGEHGTRLYRIYRAMKDRCYNPKHNSYPRYGGRGIKVCDEWLESYIAFRDWSITHGYSDDLSIDRIDNDGDYDPSNCRWVTAHQQAEKEKKRYAEKGEHTFRQKVCKICGKPFWPSNGQEVLCSEECKTINRRQKQLAYYHRKQSGQKAGEAI